MKKKLFLLRMFARNLLIALVLAFGLVVTGCDDGKNETPPPSDTTAPTLSLGNVGGLSTTAGTTATLKFASNEAGTYYYVVLAAAASTPTAATVKAQGTAIAKGTAAATASENTINVTGLTASTTYKAYIVVADAAGNLSTVLTIANVKPVVGVPDTTAPVLSAGNVGALSSVAGTTATLKFTSNETGTYYYVVLAATAEAPTAATVKAQGTAVAKGTAAATASVNTISVTGLTTSTTYKAYIVVIDADDNTSTVLTINGVYPVVGIPDTTAPTLSAGTVSELSTTAGTTATLKFTSNEAGTYYYVVLASTVSAPANTAVKAATSGIHGTNSAVATENTINVTGLTASQTYKAYIVVEDASDNLSTVLTINGVNPGIADTTAPTIINAVIENAAPSSLVVTFSETVTAISAVGFSVNGSTAVISFNGVSGSGTTTLTFTLNGNAVYGETITLSYDATNGNVTDTAGNALAAVNNRAVANHIGAASVKAPVITGQPQAPGSNYAFNATATPLSVTANGNTGTGDLDGILTYQWLKNTANSTFGGTYINSATGTTYTPLTTTAGTLYYYVRVTSTNNAATGTKVKDVNSDIVAITVTTNVKAPVISGQPSNTGSPYAFGATATALSVTANGTSGEGDLTGSLTYQWYTTSSALVYDTTSPIGSETGTTYTPLTTTAGTLYYYVKVTSTNNTATGTTAKTLDSDIVAITVSLPVLAGTVTITGASSPNPFVGETLTADTSGLANKTGTPAYTWKRNGSDAVIGTNATYQLVAADADYYWGITVTVSYSGNTGNKTSAATGAVLFPVLTGTVTITGASSPNPEVGDTLTADTSGLANTIGTPAYAWKRSGSDAVIGTNATYQLVAADKDHTITVTVRYSGNGGNKTSAATGTVSLPALAGTVTISGGAAPQVGGTLTANTGGLTNGSGGYSCIWKWSGSDSVIGTSPTYQLVPADVGHTITVTVSYTGNIGSKTSAATGTVTSPAPIDLPIDLTGKTSLNQIRDAISPGLASFTGAGTQDDPWVIPLKNLDLSISSNLENLYKGADAAIISGKISLDLTECTASTGTITGMNSSTLPFVTRRRFTAITLPATVTNLAAEGGIFSGVFSSFSSLKSISASGVTNVGFDAFHDCDALTTVSLPAATSIGNDAFYECDALTTVSLPAATSIGNNAFYGCRALTTVSLPAATSIGNNAFYGCNALTSVSLPAATSIGNNAFTLCRSLTTVRLGAVPPTSLGSNIFSVTDEWPITYRSITIAWPTGAWSAYTTWWTTATTHWGVDLPSGGIVLAASGYTP